jgi:hypothetical protein
MISERRHTARKECNIAIEVSLRAGMGGLLIAGPLPAHIVDYSAGGLRISLLQIHVDNHHFFYEGQECEGVVLHAELAGEAGIRVSIPLRPKWLDRDLYNDEGVKPFLIGAELLNRDDSASEALRRAVK